LRNNLVYLVFEALFFAGDPVLVAEAEDDDAAWLGSLDVILKGFRGEVTFHVDARSHDDVVLLFVLLWELVNPLPKPHFTYVIVEPGLLGRLDKMRGRVYAVDVIVIALFE
jgi:hypothetical protein